MVSGGPRLPREPGWGDAWGGRLGTLRGHVEYAEGCRAVGVDSVTRLRGLCWRDGHVRRLTECGRGIGLSLIGLGLSPSLLKGQGLGGIGGGFRLDSGIVAGLVLVARHVTRRGLVPLLVRSLALAIPPFKVIDIHTGRPLASQINTCQPYTPRWHGGSHGM